MSLSMAFRCITCTVSKHAGWSSVLWASQVKGVTFTSPALFIHRQNQLFRNIPMCLQTTVKEIIYSPWCPALSGSGAPRRNITLIWIFIPSPHFLKRQQFQLNPSYLLLHFTFNSQCSINRLVFVKIHPPLPPTTEKLLWLVFPCSTVMCWFSAQLDGIDCLRKSGVYSITSLRKCSPIARRMFWSIVKTLGVYMCSYLLGDKWDTLLSSI